MNASTNSGTGAGRPVVVEAADVHKSYGAVKVLDGVDLTVREGEVVLVLGPSGGGKSTFLRTLNHLEHIDSGTIRVCGDLIGQRDRGGRRVPLPERRTALQRRAIGMVFQQFNLFPTMTAAENVMAGPVHVHGADRAAARADALELLETVGLADKADSYPALLSGGQQQRVAIARALAMKPRVMLFDEPTSALDPEMVTEVLDVMVRLRAEGMTVIVVSHEMGFARAAADRVVFLSEGRVLEDGPPDAFFSAPRHERTRRFLKKIL
ncbi:amino acid ABC transporter ATP-binding protein [Streptomyces sp. 8K308]|uniref:amino acid ABC transporter ATP-binding protein n=1 Tax=Streptomyces sp. 8K308 TaxID=2530388 RepID=UPI00104F9E73|nr:amino acid ABC transporter ATP-binding protein [Streptomyces sp. 8K308]TDC19598.1 amino acid ABC transporter ATP-binding protein [Streptomyces sp. 8K308]